MNDPADKPDWGAEERFLADLLRSEPLEPTPECLRPEEVALLAERGDRTPNAGRMRRHLAVCDLCTREFAAASEALALFREADRESAAQVAPGQNAPSPDQAIPRPGWWSRLVGPVLSLSGALAAAAVLFVTAIRPQQLQITALRQEQGRHSQREQQMMAHSSTTTYTEAIRLLTENAELKGEAARLKAGQQHNSDEIAALGRERDRYRGVAERLQRQVAATPPARGNPPDSDLLRAWREKGLRGTLKPGVKIPPTTYASGSGPKQIAAEEPSKSSSVPAARPLFRWKPFDGEDVRYVVTIVRDRKVVETSGPVKETEWRSARPLRPGSYVWQVRAVKPAGQTTGSDPEAETLAISDQTPFERIEAGALRTDLLTLAVRYAALRQWQPAQEAANRVIEIAPGDPDATKLLRQIAEQRAQAQRKGR